MGEAGEDDLVDVAHHVGEGIAPLGRGARQARADRSGLRLREHGILFHLLHVARDALDEGRLRIGGNSSGVMCRGSSIGKPFTLTAAGKRPLRDSDDVVARGFQRNRPWAGVTPP